MGLKRKLRLISDSERDQVNNGYYSPIRQQSPLTRYPQQFQDQRFEFDPKLKITDVVKENQDTTLQLTHDEKDTNTHIYAGPDGIIKGSDIRNHIEAEMRNTTERTIRSKASSTNLSIRRSRAERKLDKMINSTNQ